jgi:predicted nucleotidyltransferase
MKVINKAVAKDNNCLPKFYVIGGSHIYGFKSDVGGDIDVRGFHLAPAHDFFKVKRPKEQIIINQGKITHGYEDYADIEFVSYELRKFGKLLSVMNFNILEWLYKGKVIMNGEPLWIDTLKAEIPKFLPGDVPYHYQGMAMQNYKKYLNPKGDSYKPTAKKFLYVLRGLLGAEYIQGTKTIESDINVLADTILSEYSKSVVERLIEIKKKRENKTVPIPLEQRARSLILSLNKTIMRYKKVGNNEELESFINNWMIKVRGIVT